MIAAHHHHGGIANFLYPLSTERTAGYQIAILYKDSIMRREEKVLWSTKQICAHSDDSMREHELGASTQASKDGMAMVFSLCSISPSFLHSFILSFFQLLLHLRVSLRVPCCCRQV